MGPGGEEEEEEEEEEGSVVEAVDRGAQLGVGRGRTDEPPPPPPPPCFAVRAPRRAERRGTCWSGRRRLTVGKGKAQKRDAKVIIA